MAQCHVNVNDAVKKIKITTVIHGKNRFRIRLIIGKWLILAACKVIGCAGLVLEDPKEELK